MPQKLLTPNHGSRLIRRQSLLDREQPAASYLSRRVSGLSIGLQVEIHGTPAKVRRRKTMMKTYRQTSRLLVVSTAAAAMVLLLAGCPRAVKVPVSLVAGDLTLAVPTVVKGTAIDPITLPQASGGEGALTYALAPNVPGLTFDPETRQLSGTPTEAGTYPLSYTATDAAGASATLSFTVVVRPTLWGTWRTTVTWYDDDELITEVKTLTFTKSRYIRIHSVYRSDGSLDGSWSNSGTWTATDDTITRTWYHDDVLTSLDRDYVFPDETRNTLLVHAWDSSADETRFVRYERVPVSPSAVVGTWQGVVVGDDGRVTRTFSIGADGAFSYVEEWTDTKEEWTDGTFRLDAQWQLDEGEYFLYLTDPRGTFTPTGGAPEEIEDLPGADHRVAFAPTSEWPDRIFVSPFWNETEGYREFREFGGYWIGLQRQ